MDTIVLPDQRRHIRKFCVDSGWSLQDELRVIDDRDEWSERDKEHCAISPIWWWWWWVFNTTAIIIMMSITTVIQYICCILTSDPAKHAIPKTAEVAYSVVVDELGWQYGTRLKSHGTVTHWCTGRGSPVNCMTVISARWWSKHAIPKTAEVVYSVGHLWEEIEWVSNYYITQCTGNSISLEIRELEKWCCRENSTQQKGPSGPPIEQLGIRRVGDKMR